MGQARPRTAGATGGRGALRRGDARRLEGCLDSPFPEVVVHGLRWAARDREPEAAPWVRRALTHDDPAVRREAARAAGVLDLPSAVSELVGLLEDPDEGVQVEAAAALGRISVPLASGVAGPHQARARARRAQLAPARVRSSFDRYGQRLVPVAPPETPAAAAAGEPAPEEPASAGGAIPRPRGPWDGGGDPPRPAAEVRPRRRSRKPSRKPSQAAPARPRDAGPGVGLELLFLFAVVGFLMGRFLAPAPAAPQLAGAAGVDVELARRVLFPGGDVFSRIGRGASLAREGDARGIPMIDEGVREILFPELGGAVRTLTLDAAPAPDGELVDDPWPDEAGLEDLDAAAGPPAAMAGAAADGHHPPAAAPTPASGDSAVAGSAATPVAGAAGRSAAPAAASGGRDEGWGGRDGRSPAPRVAPATPAGEGALPPRLALSEIERRVYLLGARRYLDLGDPQRAIDLLSRVGPAARNDPEVLDLRRRLGQKPGP